MDARYQIEELVMNMSFMDLDIEKKRTKIRDDVLKITNKEEAHKIVSDIYNKTVADMLFKEDVKKTERTAPSLKSQFPKGRFD